MTDEILHSSRIPSASSFFRMLSVRMLMLFVVLPWLSRSFAVNYYNSVRSLDDTGKTDILSYLCNRVILHAETSGMLQGSVTRKCYSAGLPR
jgi:hypothetical protein